jgi:DNA-binding NarL/FixJ family response regulator
MKPIRILLAADPNLIRRSLRPPLESECDWHICGETCDGREAVKMCERLQPEVVVIDASLPEIDGVEAVRRIKAARPETEALILIGNENEELMRQILATGARGYLSRSEAAEKIIPAIKALCEHRQYLASPAARLLFENHLKREVKKERDEPRSALRSGALFTRGQPSPSWQVRHR